MFTVMGGNFKFQVLLFWRFGDLKNESHILKKMTPLDTDGFLKNKISLLVLPKSGGEGKCPQLAPSPWVHRP
jgi:hypothetical protein